MNGHSLKILFVIGGLNMGGAESQLAMLATSLAEKEYTCEVYALRTDGPLGKVLRDAGVVVHDGHFQYGGSWLYKFISLFSATIKLWLIAIKFRPHVIHAYLPFTNFIGAVAGRAALVPVIITSRRALGTHQDRNAAWKWLDRVANLLSTKVTANSQAVVEDTLKRGGIEREKLVCIYNGLDFSGFRANPEERQALRAKMGIAEHEFLWGKVANLIPYKGHADLLVAFSKLSEHSSKLILVGEDRGIQQALQAQAESLSIHHRIIFLGRRLDVPALLFAMDGYVMASHEEGFSNAILEAMAAGLPIVATDVGGNREALQDGQCGVIVPPHDPTAMAAAMSRLMLDTPYRLQLGLAAKHTVQERYSVGAMVNTHIQLYRDNLQ